MAGGPLLRVRDLTLTVPTPKGPAAVVDRLSFELERGASLGLLGESGCGKTLTALALLRLLPPAVRLVGGAVEYAGVDLTTLPESSLRRYRGGRIAMVFQEPMTALNPVLRIGTQIEEVLRLHRPLARAERRTELIRLLGDVGLPEPERQLRCYPHELSGGQRQRVLIAMALAGEPELLVADEPTTALDVTLQAQILDLLAALREQRGLSLLWIGHDLGVVAEVCERVAVLYAGRLVEEGALDSLFARPMHPYTLALLRAVPRVDRRAAPAGVPGRVPPPQDLPTGCRFRDRCPDAHEACQEEPPAQELGPGHRAACWLAQATGARA